MIEINPAMLIFTVGLYINDSDDLVVGNGNGNHNYWEAHTRLEITNNALTNILQLECNHEPTADADIAAMLVYNKKVSTYHQYIIISAKCILKL